MPSHLESYPRDELLQQLNNPDLGNGPITLTESAEGANPAEHHVRQPPRPVLHRWKGSLRGMLGDAE